MSGRGREEPEPREQRVGPLLPNPVLPLPFLETRGAHTLDLSGELPAALEQIFDSQRGCDLSIRVKVKDQEEEGPHFCAHRLILAANPEAQALCKAPGSTVTMEVDAECLPVVRDFIR